MDEITKTEFFLLEEKISKGECDKICSERPQKKVNPETGDVVYIVGMQKWARSINGYYFAQRKLARLVSRR